MLVFGTALSFHLVQFQLVWIPLNWIPSVVTKPGVIGRAELQDTGDG